MSDVRDVTVEDLNDPQLSCTPDAFEAWVLRERRGGRTREEVALDSGLSVARVREVERSARFKMDLLYARNILFDRHGCETLQQENERLKAELADANQRLARDRAAAEVINESIDYLERQERAVVPPWTTESPTVPGRYWMREPAAVVAEIVDVVSFYVPGGGNLLAFWGEAKERRINHFAPGTLWSGPIPEPPARKPVSAGQETP